MNTEIILLKSMSLLGLDSHIKKLVNSERNITDQVLKVITELDGRRGYAELGYSSLFSYLTQGVGYSESAAQRRIASARLMVKVSEPVQSTLRSKLQEGALNLSQVAKLASMVQSIEQAAKNNRNLDPAAAKSIATSNFIQNILPEIEHKDSVKTDSLIANAAHNLFPHLDLESNKPAPKTKIRQRAAGSVAITLTLTAEQNEKLQKVLAKKSHSIPNGDINNLFEKLLNRELKGYDAKTDYEARTDSAASYTTKAASISKEQINSKRQNKDNDGTQHVSSEVMANLKSGKKRKYISIKIKRRIFANADHQCQFKSPLTGERCMTKKFLTIEHIVPLALGGTNDESNLTCHCFSHNLAEARRMGVALQ